MEAQPTVWMALTIHPGGPSGRGTEMNPLPQCNGPIPRGHWRNVRKPSTTSTDAPQPYRDMTKITIAPNIVSNRAQSAPIEAIPESYSHT